MARSCNLNAKRTFSEAFDANVAETEAAFRQRRTEMDKAWDDLDAQSQAFEQRMVEVGITKPSGSEENILRLNVGGSPVNVRRSTLEGKGHLGHLFENVWDKRLPRDADGLVILDFSPSCVKYVIHTLLTASGPASGTAKLALGDGLAADEKAYLPYVASALGLAEYFPTSTVLERDEFGPMSATVMDWCPGEPSRLELVYRASRDGWSPEAFHALCGDDSPSTVTLYRVRNTVRGTLDSVVGGFSSVPWTPPGRKPCCCSSPGAFVFMLKDGTRTGSSSFKPVRWGICRESEGDELICGPSISPSFAGDLEMGMGRSSSKPCRLRTDNAEYKIPDRSAFLSLDGHDVVEMETFRVCYANTLASPPPPEPGLMDIPPVDASMSIEGGRDDDIRSFGVFVADSLMEEKVALHQAHSELKEANVKAAASTDALAAIYGVGVAAGGEETAVELNVRGTRMTTLQSTLQACPDSALARQFDPDKWPATEKDIDKRGRQLVDCSPSVFSKVLDVLRVRKRMAFPSAWGSVESDVRVVVKAADRTALEEFVNMFFPGCESFIMDLVASARKDRKARS